MSTWNKNDLKRQFEKAISDGLVSTIQQVASPFSHSTAFWLAVGSRETNLTNRVGDKGNGIGYWQLDLRFEKGVSTKLSAAEQLTRAIKIYESKVAQIERVQGKKFKVWSSKSRKHFYAIGKKVDNVDKRRIATTAYNNGLWASFGHSNGNIDSVSSHKDYGKDVYARATIFAQHLEEWGIEQDAVKREIELQGKYFEGEKKGEKMGRRLTPGSKPNIKEADFRKVVKYFYGDKSLKEIAPVVQVGVRGYYEKSFGLKSQNDAGYYDDAVAQHSNGVYKTFNWNTDPSRFKKSGKREGYAVLREGVHEYFLFYHHAWNNSKRYIALRPKTDGARVPVYRWSPRLGKFVLRTGVALNQHAGYDSTTGSAGCQTCPYRQYWATDGFIDHVCEAFGVDPIKHGPGRRPKSLRGKYYNRFEAQRKKIENNSIIYILITLDDLKYIQSLDESDFDSKADLQYQLKRRFVNVPKIEPPKPPLPPVIDVEAKEVEQEEVVSESPETDTQETTDEASLLDTASEYMPASLTDAQERIGTLQTQVETVQSSVNQIGQTIESGKQTFSDVKQAIPGGGVNEEGTFIEVQGQSWKSIILIWWKQVLAVITGVLGFLWNNPIYILAALVLFGIAAYLYNRSKQRDDDEMNQKRRIASDPNRQNVTELSPEAYKRKMKLLKAAPPEVEAKMEDIDEEEYLSITPK